jgi:hypothetical protein
MLTIAPDLRGRKPIHEPDVLPEPVSFEELDPFDP